MLRLKVGMDAPGSSAAGCTRGSEWKGSHLKDDTSNAVCIYDDHGISLPQDSMHVHKQPQTHTHTAAQKSFVDR